jgi:hypothetical protein
MVGSFSHTGLSQEYPPTAKEEKISLRTRIIKTPAMCERSSREERANSQGRGSRQRLGRDIQHKCSSSSSRKSMAETEMNELFGTFHMNFLRGGLIGSKNVCCPQGRGCGLVMG